MSVNVECRCGAVISVREELAGCEVTCRVCGATVLVPKTVDQVFDLEDEPIGIAGARPALPSSASGVSTPAPQTTAAPGEGKMTCWACAEEVPVDSLTCPVCGESLTKQLSREKQQEMVANMLEALDRHLDDPAAAAADDALKGSPLSVATVVLAVFIGLCIVSIVIGAGMQRRGAEAYIGLGIILGLVFFIALLGSLAGDIRCSRIQKASTPTAAFRRYLKAIRSGRWRKAFTALVPTARQVGPVETLEFDSFPSREGPFSITQVDDFRKYWQSIFRGPSMNTRTFSVKSLNIRARLGGGLVLLEMETVFYSYPTYLYLTLLAGIIPAIVLIAALQHKEQRKTRKLLVERRGRWFIADAEFEGLMDNIETAFTGAPPSASRAAQELLQDRSLETA